LHHYGAQDAPMVNRDVGIKRIYMNTKYYAALIATALVALSSYGTDKLSVIFPDTTNLVFTVPISDKVGERPYDAHLEYPSEYEDGHPTKFGRTGLGFYIHVEVTEETEKGVQCKLKVDHHTLSDWNQYDIGNQIIAQQPVFSAFATESDIILPIGQWFDIGSGLKYLYQREETSQQSVPEYPPQGVGSPTVTLGPKGNIMDIIFDFLSAHTMAVGWGLACVGWFVSSYLGFRYASRRFANEKAESVFEEVSVLIEQSNVLMTVLHNSFSRDEPPAKREELWKQFVELQRRYLGNHSRLQFLLNKYYGNMIATKVDFVMSAQFHDIDYVRSCEDAHQIIDNIVAYRETWTGSLSTNPTGEWDGYKWKMMSKCGMNVRPFIKKLREAQKNGT